MARLYSYVVVAAASVLLADVLPMVLMAKAMLAFCVAAAVHAVLLRWLAWMYRTSWRKLTVRWLSDQVVYKIGVVFLACWYLYGTVHEGGSMARAAVVEFAFFLGVWLTLHPREIRRGVVREIRGRLS